MIHATMIHRDQPVAAEVVWLQLAFIIKLRANVTRIM